LVYNELRKLAAKSVFEKVLKPNEYGGIIRDPL
jgi:hypothetical protein